MFLDKLRKKIAEEIKPDDLSGAPRPTLEDATTFQPNTLMQPVEPPAAPNPAMPFPVYQPAPPPSFANVNLQDAIPQSLDLAPQMPTPPTVSDALNPLAYGNPQPYPVAGGFADANLQPPTGAPPLIDAAPVPESQRLQNEINALNSKDYSKGVYLRPDGTETNSPTTNGVANQVVKAPGKDRDKKWSLGEKILGGIEGLLEGGAVQAIKNATDRNWGEKQSDLKKLSTLYPQYKQAAGNEEFQAQTDLRKAQAQNALDKPALEREKLRTRIEQETQRFNNRLALRNRDADIKAGEAKIFVDDEGKVWKQFLKPDSTGKLRENEAVVNPTTGEQEFVPGEQMVDWQSPNTGAWTKVKAKQVLMPDANLAVGNATREQQVNIKNADNRMEVEKANIQNQLTYQMQVNTVLSTLAANDATLATLGGNVAGLRAKMDAEMAEAQQLLGQMEQYNLDPANSTSAEIKAANAAKEKLQKRYNDLADSFNKSNTDLYAELGKTEAGRMKAEQLKKLMPKAPPKLTFTPIEAVKVSGGVGGKYSGQSYRISDVRAAFGSKTDAEIKQIIEANGGKVIE